MLPMKIDHRVWLESKALLEILPALTFLYQFFSANEIFSFLLLRDEFILQIRVITDNAVESEKQMRFALNTKFWDCRSGFKTPFWQNSATVSSILGSRVIFESRPETLISSLDLKAWFMSS